MSLDFEEEDFASHSSESQSSSSEEDDEISLSLLGETGSSSLQAAKRNAEATKRASNFFLFMLSNIIYLVQFRPIKVYNLHS